MKLVIDMNLSPRLYGILVAAGYETEHWSDVGDRAADDSEILAWARSRGCTVLTHDLDFGAILAATRADSPSVLQVRTQDVSPEHLGPILVSALQQYQAHLERGALVTCDESSVRSRIPPYPLTAYEASSRNLATLDPFTVRRPAALGVYPSLIFTVFPWSTIARRAMSLTPSASRPAA